MVKTIKAGDVVSALLLPTGWVAMLFSIALYLLFWRVDHEPGAREVPGLLWGAISLCSLGGFVFLGSHIFLIVRRAWLWLGIAWVGCAFLLVMAVSLSPILLLFLV